MWRASLRDLQWRRRRFLIALAATGMVFALTLLLSGASHSLHAQDRRIVESFDADAWLVARGVSGPFTTSRLLDAGAVDDVRRETGSRADPVIFVRSALTFRDQTKDVNIVGYRLGGLGAPRVDDGRALQGPGQVVVDRELGLDVGERVTLSGQSLRVVGEADEVTFYFGTPTVFLPLEQVQDLFIGGQPLVSAVIAEDRPSETPEGLQMMTDAEVVEDLKRPTKSGDQTIGFINVLLWLVAAGIIGSIVYLSALERSRDFAVMKAVGTSNRALLVGLGLQAVLLSVTSALVAAGVAQLLIPGFPFSVSIPGRAYATLVVVAVLVGLLASIAGLRRAVRVDPALAFGGG